MGSKKKYQGRPSSAPRQESGAELDPVAAKQALEAVEEAKAAASKHTKAPTGFYAALGLAMGLLISGVALTPKQSVLFTGVGFLIAMASMVWYQKTAGTWGWGDLKGEGAWVAWLMFGIAGVALVLALWSVNFYVSVVGGAITFVSWAILGPIWDRFYQRQVEQR